MDGSVTRLEELTSPGLEELRSRRPVALWPVGVIEPHGPHLPLATDTLISVAMCERAATLISDPPIVVLPPLPFGVTRYGAAFAGAIGITEATLRAVVLDVAASLTAEGFRRLVIVNNHFEPEQVSTLRAAASEAGALYLDRSRPAPQRPASHGRVSAGIVSRRALRDIAHPGRRSGAGRCRRDDELARV